MGIARSGDGAFRNFPSESCVIKLTRRSECLRDSMPRKTRGHAPSTRKHTDPNPLPQALRCPEAYVQVSIATSTTRLKKRLAAPRPALFRSCAFALAARAAAQEAMVSSAMKQIRLNLAGAKRSWSVETMSRLPQFDI